MTWTPSANARAVGESVQGSYPYVGGSATSANDSVVQRSPGAGTRVLATFLRSRWSLSSAGMQRAAAMSSPARRADGTYRKRDLHEDGRAIDAMIGTDLRKGSEIADFLIENAPALGVQYLIFDGIDWCVSTVGPAFEGAASSQDRRAWGRDNNPHRDHVHVELTPAFAADGEAMRASLEAITGVAQPPAPTGGRAPSSATPAPTVPPPAVEYAIEGPSQTWTLGGIGVVFLVAVLLDYARGK